jgi:hypothetical protein
MPDERMVKMVYEWKPMATRSLGRPKNRWKNDVKNDLNIMGMCNWKKRTVFRTNINGKESLRRPKHSMIEDVEPKGGEEEYGQVAGFCELGNESLGSIRCGIFLDWLRSY